MSGPDRVLGNDRVLGKWTFVKYVGPSASGKTGIWRVYAVAGSVALGEVRWFGRWRQYVFAPGDGTVWNPDCLNEVSRFVVKCTVDHQAAAARRRDAL